MPTSNLARRAFLRSATAAAAAAVLPAAAQPAFRAPVGLALYSLRYLAEKDLPAALALARELGFQEVETGELHGRSPAEFLGLLNAAGVHATSYGAAYDALDKDADAVAAQARTLGAGYVVCSTIPHSAKHLAVRDCQPAADHLNRWGERLAASGLRLCYHTHGTEFDKAPDGTVFGTLFDTLAKLTNPKFVNFEMDIFWVVYGYQDPVRLLRRYPRRFPLMHIKDIRKGTVLGGSPADVLEEESVPLGTGLVDVRAALLAAQTCGVRHYFLEEEAADAVPQIRQSLRYLATLR
ncbi:MAG: sugar phosphate isomerase/epimerase [Bryobacteraceae bacterium]|jgi:sugar phosphate isomerase/epimerase